MNISEQDLKNFKTFDGDFFDITLSEEEKAEVKELFDEETRRQLEELGA